MTTSSMSPRIADPRISRTAHDCAVLQVILELRVDPDDMGRVIGKGGRIASALRTLVQVVAARAGKRVTLEIV